MSIQETHKLDCWAKVFDGGTLARGQAYAQQSRVLTCDSHTHEDHVLHIVADVQGHRSRPYEVDILINFMENDIEAHCTCPVGFHCKHAAAVLLTVMPDVQKAPLSLSLQTPLNAPLNRWMQQLDKTHQKPELAVEQVAYLLDYDKHNKPGHLLLRVGLSRPLKKGGLSKPKPFSLANMVDQEYWDPHDFAILGQLELLSHHNPYSFKRGEYVLSGKQVALLLPALIKAERCRWHSMQSLPLSWGKPETAEVSWKMQDDGTQQIHFALPQSTQMILPLAPLHYIDAETAAVGEVKTALPPEISATLFTVPPIPPTQVQTFSRQLEKQLPPRTTLPLPKLFSEIKQKQIAPIPHLRLYEEKIPFLRQRDQKTFEYVHQSLIVAQCQMAYDDIKIAVDDSTPQLQCVRASALHYYPRDRWQERKHLDILQQHNIQPVTQLEGFSNTHRPPAYYESIYYIAKAGDFDQIRHFQMTKATSLSAAGWMIKNEVAEWPMDYVEIESWYSQLDETSEYDWFHLEVGIIVDGKPISLLSHLIQAIRQGQTINNDNHTLIPLSEGKYVNIPAERLQRMMQVVLQFIDPGHQSPTDAIRVSRYQAALLAEMEKAFQATQHRWLGNQDLLTLGKKLLDFKRLKKTKIPASFKATLRPYQQQGVDWLQFLREYALNGILADDMGLGKTLQALAHLSIEKQKKRLTQPCLIIAPTSVVPNWIREAARFAPTLRVLMLQGPDRQSFFDEMEQYDVVVTSYALIVRDKAHLLTKDYYFLILDEAHYIKNKQAKLTQIVQQICAKHRLCLTGTPLENHLGELWSQFHFLMPGLLGNSRAFQQRFRYPIEKQQDDQARSLLTRLTKPFLLRRTKKAVIQELPEKTDIIKNIELSKTQRDLYESIRLAMHKKVKKAIDQQGIERSHIIILDALLKLRQICCDPRLLTLPAARAVKSSSKLKTLLSMLQEMLEEGRKILLFSQFTSMLSLIEAALKEEQISYLKLTGQTTNRLKVIDQFQQGEVPLFLISLKAGGIGLNLTAADTVIHYDPWWNPAVEDQATDRAHRIGQKKAVFVYKLITANTVEEKILTMQNKKRALSEALFGNNTNIGKINKSDLEALFVAG